MSTFQPGEVVLLAFPYADVSAAKRRPALVLLDAGDQDIVVLRVTSQPSQSPFDVGLVEWRRAGLLFPSTVRIHKLATLAKQLVERRLGALVPDDWNRVRMKVRQLLRSVGSQPGR